MTTALDGLSAGDFAALRARFDRGQLTAADRVTLRAACQAYLCSAELLISDDLRAQIERVAARLGAR